MKNSMYKGKEHTGRFVFSWMDGNGDTNAIQSKYGAYIRTSGGGSVLRAAIQWQGEDRM